MERPSFDTVILSDLHLGSDTSRAREALRVLRSLSFKRLVLLGDIFCDLNFGRLKKHHWEFLSYIRKLSNPKRAIEVVWVEGNHDQGLTEVMSHLVGIKVHREYVWHENGVKYLAVHGHQFDRFVLNDSLSLCTIGGPVFLLIQRLDTRKKRFARYLDRLNTRWLRLTEKVADGAFRLAEHRRADVVVCGHTHQAVSRERNGIRYYNTGAWTVSTPTYITIRDNEVNIHAYVEGTDDCYPGEERGEAAAEAAGFAAAAGLLGDEEYEGLPC